MKRNESSPRRWPAEWEAQEAVWFSWPHREEHWQSELLALEKKFSHILTTIARFQKVKINASSKLWPRIENSLPSLEHIEFYEHPTDDVWCRDHGATFTLENNELHAVDWKFNAWGGKFPPWDKDDRVAQKMALACHATHQRSSLTLEGGAIEGNGEGLILTTEAVALNPNRNPELSKSEVEKELKKQLGAKKVFWLARGIEGDDTDGHIDDLTRFVKADLVVSAIEDSSSSPNYRILQENLERLQDLRTPSGSSVEVIELPMPDPLITKNWRLPALPASYANFLIINDAILVPSFQQAKNDQRAEGILKECFPNREVIPIDCSDLIFEGGALHCLSQQEPKLPSPSINK